MKAKPAIGGLVYSTEAGRMCPACRRPVGQCKCAQRKSAQWKSAPDQPAAPSDGIVRVSRETKGRGGKAVTVVQGMQLDDAALASLGQQLKAACGSGGTVKDGVIEVQGDHCERVIELLTARGHRVKRAGG